MQALTFCVLHYQVDMFCCVYSFIKFHYLWMSKFVKNFNFSYCTLAPLYVHEFVAIIDFYSHFLSSLPVHWVFYNCISSVPDRLAYLVIVDIWAVGSWKLRKLRPANRLRSLNLSCSLKIVLESLSVFLEYNEWRELTLSFCVKLFSSRTVMRFFLSAGAAVCTRSLLASA